MNLDQKHRVIEPMADFMQYEFMVPALTVPQEFKTDPTVSFINRPVQTAYRRNGVHELVLGPKLSIEDLGLPQIPVETEF